MKRAERYYARKKVNEIQRASNAKSLNAIAKAAGVDLTDPEFANLPAQEAMDIIEYRIKRMLNRAIELEKGA